MGGGDKTEKATPKRQAEAQKKGQIAKSADLNGSIVLLAGLAALIATGPRIVARCEEAMRETLAQAATPGVVSVHGVGTLLAGTAQGVVLSVAPVVVACAAAAVVAGAAQTRLRTAPEAVKPDPKKLNPLAGAKQIFGPNALFEGAKSISKVCIVGAIVALALIPALPELGTLVGLGPRELGAQLADMIGGIAMRAAAAYLVIGCADYAWQRHRTAKSMRMTKQEVREEGKGQELPAEVRGAMRRRQFQASRARMMAAVPEADVVVTNPTHFSVALKYDGSHAAPEVVAKGQDLLALRIRELAAEHGVPVVPDPPLARGLHASVEVGQQIPEEFFQAVAQVLAFVFRVAGRSAVS
jgi:flagellar biosynthetic protein FlhB